jgi:hypothetical protein
MVMKLEHQEQREKPPYLAHQMSKCFYDTFTGTATRAVHCGSQFGEGLGRLSSSYRESTMDMMVYVVQAARA